jgi:hypothetical protein
MRPYPSHFPDYASQKWQGCVCSVYDDAAHICWPIPCKAISAASSAKQEAAAVPIVEYLSVSYYLRSQLRPQYFERVFIHTPTDDLAWVLHIGTSVFR